MPTYAPVPAYADRRRHPRTLLLILGGHAAVLALVLSAKMDLPQKWGPTITKVDLLEEPAPPEPAPPKQPEPRTERIDRVETIVPLPQPRDSEPLPLPNPLPLPLPEPGPDLGAGDAIQPLPKAEPVRTGPRFRTPDALVKPPYPQSKLRMEEEAVLRLRLSIDARGRVTAVDPVGSADPAFLGAARRHLIAHWRYTPATVDGRPVATTTEITLRFQLD